MKDSNHKKTKKTSNKSLKGGESSTTTAATATPTTTCGVSDAVIAKPLEVVVYNNAVDKALRAFRALVQKERILSTYKEKQRYEKPSDRKRRKRNEMKRKLMEISYNKDQKSE